MSFLEYSVKSTPQGARKLLYLNWPLVVLAAAVAGVGFMMLYSVAGGSMTPWAATQIERFVLGMAVMFVVALVPIWFWRNMSVVAYVTTILLLIAVEFYGIRVGGAQRWLDIGFMRLQPSELMKVTSVMLLAAYYEWLPRQHISNPLFVAVAVGIVVLPIPLILRQPDLGTSLLLMAGGGAVLFLAGVHWIYFAVVIALAIGVVIAVFQTRGTEYQLLRDYHYDRIDVFLDPSLEPLGGGYQITQAQIALGAGGMSGRGVLQGTQTQNGFLLENHTDFIFVTFAEEMGFVGSMGLLTLFSLVVIFCFVTALQTKDRFASLVSMGIAVTFFLLFAVNIAMVTGLAPVVGLPLPLVSYGGTSMLVLLGAFGLVQSAHIHRPR